MAFGKFLVGASKAMDLNPIVDIYADARRRREDRKQTIEDRDYQERLGLTTTATSLGLPVGDDATSGEIRSQIAGHFAPGAANKRALQTEADLGGMQTLES